MYLTALSEARSGIELATICTAAVLLSFKLLETIPPISPILTISLPKALLFNDGFVSIMTCILPLGESATAVSRSAEILLRWEFEAATTQDPRDEKFITTKEDNSKPTVSSLRTLLVVFITLHFLLACWLAPSRSLRNR